ncbi:MAG: ROK family protein, partial [Actinomycetota bacterium]
MPETRTAIGVDVGGTGTKAAIVDHEGGILLKIERPTDPTSGTKGVIAIVEDLLQRAHEVEARPECVGVGAAGFIDASSGSVTFAPNLVYDDPQVAVALRTRTSLPVVVEIDAYAAAWGELAFGAAQGLDNVALITIGTGIGSGFIVDGHLLR